MTCLISAPIQNRLEQVLVNLIHNAVKFTHPGGEVVLLAESASDGIRFGVKDTGIGIPAEDVSRVFNVSIVWINRAPGSGTGLGLSIARHIVEAHQGRIWVDSNRRARQHVFLHHPESLSFHICLAFVRLF